LAGRVLLITGASSGIGEATALAAAGEGMRLVLAARREEELQRVSARVEEIGAEALVCPTDVRARDQVERLVAAAEQRFGRVDALLANAGIGRPQWAHEIADADVLSLMEVNLLGVIRCAQAVLPDMLARESGHIVTVSSVAAGLAVPRSAVYAATKAGVHRYCEGLRREVRPRGIEVTDVLPGVIATPMTANLRGWPKSPVERVARTIIGVLRRPRPWVVTPGWYRLALALNRLSPGAMDVILGALAARERRQAEPEPPAEP